MRCAAIKRAPAFAFLTRAEDWRISHTLIAPTRTNVTPSQRLAELFSTMDSPLQGKDSLGIAEVAPAETASANHSERGGTRSQNVMRKIRGRQITINFI